MKSSQKSLSKAITSMERINRKKTNEVTDDFTTLLGWHWKPNTEKLVDVEWTPVAISAIYRGRNVTPESPGVNASFYVEVAYAEDTGKYAENAMIFFTKYDEMLDLTSTLPQTLPNEKKRIYDDFIDLCKEDAQWKEVEQFSDHFSATVNLHHVTLFHVTPYIIDVYRIFLLDLLLFIKKQH